MVRALIVFMMLMVAAFPLPAADETKQVAGATVVEVPLFVQDKDGNPIRDIRLEEIRIFEDGKEQKLELFLPVDLGRRAESKAPPQVTRRHFILFFDLTFNSPNALVRSQRAALRFVEKQMPVEDQAAIYAYSSLKGVFQICNFTSDRALLASALSSFGIDRKFELSTDSAGFFNERLGTTVREGRYLNDAPDSGRGATTHDELSRDKAYEWMRDMNALRKSKDEEFYRSMVGGYLDGLRSIARSLEFYPGRKFLLYFSSGFDTKVFGVRDLRQAAAESEVVASGDFEQMAASGEAVHREVSVDMAEVLNQAMKFFSSSDCRVYTLDAEGLAGESNLDFSDASAADPEARGRRQASLFSIADETGGEFYKNANDLTQPLDDVLRSTSAYYLLAYAPPQRSSKKVGAYHEIKVEVNRPGARVAYRPGYHDPRPFQDLSAEERRLQIAESLNSTTPLEGLRLRAQAMVFPETPAGSPLAVVLQMPGEQFKVEARDLQLEVYAFAISPEGRFEGYTHGFCRVPAEKMNGKFQQSGIRYSDVMLVRPGVAYQVRLVVRNNGTGEIGTALLSVTTRKDAETFTMATPFFTVAKSDWTNVVGFDPSKPPARISQLNGEYPVGYRFKPCPADVQPALTDGTSRALVMKLYRFGFDPVTKEPDLSIAWEFFDQQGHSLGTPQHKLLEKPSRPADDRIEYLFDLKAASLPKGLCWLKVTVRDRIGGGGAVDWVPLDIR